MVVISNVLVFGGARVREGVVAFNHSVIHSLL